MDPAHATREAGDAAGDAVDESRFRVMGSDAHLVVVGGPTGLAERARRRLAELEARWSRFEPTSEVSRVNDRAGRWTEVSADTLLLFDRAVDARQLTDGRFDPTLLGEVLRAGYRTSFERLDRDVPPPRAVPPARAGGGTVEVDLDRHVVRVGPGAGFDPGGMGKGLAADLVAAELLDGGATGACVNLGGDLRVRGTGPAGGSWVVEVEDPREGHAGTRAALLDLADGAVATTSRCRRRWVGADGRTAHHLIDPSTGGPARGPVLSATVVAARGWQAEALAKSAFLAGPGGFEDVVGRVGATGLLVTEYGILAARGLTAFLVDPAAPSTDPRVA